jgi:hypothetical protein
MADLLSKKILQDRIAQLDAVLAGGAERVPTELGPIQYNLAEAKAERSRLVGELARIDTGSRRTRLIAVWPARS